MTHSESTDWKKSNEPCCLIDLPLPNDFIPVIERLKHERIQKEEPIPGQITMDMI
jgi:hypothetical protein